MADQNNDASYLKFIQKVMEAETSKKEIYELIGIIEAKIEPKVIIPNENETVAISDKPKTSALFYDRIWCPTIDIFEYTGKMPDEIRFFGATNEEKLFSFQGPIIAQADPGFAKKCKFPTIEKLKKDGTYSKLLKHSTLPILADAYKAESEDDYKKMLERDMNVPSDERKAYLKNTNFIINCYHRDIALAFSRKYNRKVKTVFSSSKLQRIIYQEGDMDVILMAMGNLKIVDEEKITWEQVLELRKDKESKAKYKRFLHWLNKEMLGKSQAFIEDEIAIKLEDYESALNKHGIKTVLGTIEEVLDGKYIFEASAAIGGFSLAGHPILGFLTGAGIFVGKVGLKLAQISLDLNDIEKGMNSDIAWVYEAKKLN